MSLRRRGKATLRVGVCYLLLGETVAMRKHWEMLVMEQLYLIAVFCFVILSTHHLQYKAKKYAAHG